jgi:16S rRNA (guanine527-N7)-methyltransferase
MSGGKVRESSAGKLLLKGLKELSLSHTEKQIGLFLKYLAELKKWNKAYNLTSLKSDEEIVIKHFLDSLLYLKALPDRDAAVMDVGSGAGFPGIPMKIMEPGILLYLVEPSRKKAMFLRHVKRLLGMEAVEVIEARVEELKSPMVDVAVTRALFTVKDFHAKAGHLLRQGGSLLLSKGPKVSEELTEIGDLERNCRVITVALPLTDIKRALVVVTKERGLDEIRGSACDKMVHVPHICANAECRLRKAGCRGFEGCPGFKARG